MSPSAESNNRAAFCLMTMLFFMWGFITCLNDILIPHLKLVFDLNYVQASLVQLCFFFAYFVMSLPSGSLINRVGYQRGLVLGLALTAAGALMFLPAASAPSYGWFLAALFVLASGITLLQVAANPYVTLLGPSETASSRLNLAQALNSLGTTLAPMVGGFLILAPSARTGLTPLEQAAAVKGPYVAIAATLLLLATVFFFLRLPVPPHTVPERGERGLWRSALGHRSLLLGAAAIFVYVGAEVSIGSYLVSFMGLPHIAGLPENDAAVYVSLYWGGAMVGRFLGSLIQTRVPAHHTLTGAALMAGCLVFLSAVFKGTPAVALLLSVGLLNSIMFPTIFALGIRNLGPLTGVGSSLMVMAIVGGALIPVCTGALADQFGLQHALFLPALCYAYIAWYGSVTGQGTPASRPHGTSVARIGK
jgi:FHS family L-fucose permease-like MFS transporter